MLLLGKTEHISTVFSVYVVLMCLYTCLYLRVYEVTKKKGIFALTHILCKGDFTAGAKSQICAQLSAKSSSFEEYEHKRAVPEHSSPSVHRTTFSNRLLCTRAKHAWSVSETPVPTQRIGRL